MLKCIHTIIGGISLTSKLKDENLDYLFEAICVWKPLTSAISSLKICTVLELKSISQRLQVAKMLNERNVYSDIVNATSASTATISRVNRTKYGSDGYEIVFERLKDK